MRPWVKLHRSRSARFDALPIITRGLFDELLAHCDDDGLIRLGEASRLVLWRYIGAHPRERRTLSTHLDALLAHGAVIELEDGWSLPSFARHQADGRKSPKSADGALADHQPTTDGALTERWQSADGALTVHEEEGKSAESLNSGPGDKREREKEIRGRAEVAREPAGLPSDLREQEHAQAEAARALKRGWSEAWEHHTASPAPAAHLAAVGKLGPWLVEYRRRCPERDLEELAAAMLGGFFEAKRAIGRPRVEWLAEDPGRYLERQTEAVASTAEADRQAELTAAYRAYLDLFSDDHAPAGAADAAFEKYEELVRRNDEQRSGAGRRSGQPPEPQGGGGVRGGGGQAHGSLALAAIAKAVGER